MKTALVHDWLNGMRGGEKVLEVLCELFPLETFSIWLWEVVKERLGLRDSIPLPVRV